MALFDLAPKESPDALFGRDREVAELTRLIAARRWVVVLGPRMVGKTSLVKAVRARLRRPGAYVNLWGVRSVQGLVEGLIGGINDSATLRARLVRAARRLDGFSAGPSGISLSGSRPPLRSAWDLLNLLGAENRDCVVVLDEVQELSSNSGNLLKLLGNVFNTRPNVVFVFTGSLVGLSRTLLEPTNVSPLYGRAPVSLTLQPFDQSTSRDFLHRGAAESGIELSLEDVSEAISGPLDGTPGWLTLYGNHVAVQKLSPRRALTETIQEGKKAAQADIARFLVPREVSLYWPALKSIATGASWGSVREYMSLGTGEDVNDGKVQRVIKALESNYIVRRVEDRYECVDPMVRTYLLEAANPPRSRSTSSLNGRRADR